jgi:predicted AAA+ superfamily ATPase
MPKEYDEIVRGLAKANGIDMPDDELIFKAHQWEISHGGMSGRTAQQFINHISE